MDYEKAYKEVINSIKRIYDKTDSYNRKLIDEEFPELNKKKDESIRQALLNQFKNYQEKKINQGFGYTNEEIIAWLEKQEKKTWSEDAGKLCLDAIGLLRNYAEGVDKNSQLGQKINKADAFLSDLYHEAFYPQTYNMRKDLKTCWNEEDERIYKSIIDDTVQENQLCKEQLDWLKSLKDRVRSQSQQKQEWSAEDEANMDAIWKACGHVYGIKYQCILGDWLKSLKDKVQPQLKEEWSEYDNKMIKNIEDSLNVYSESHPCLKVVVAEELEWLKSLKDKVQPQQKQEWSDVNDSMIDGIKIAILNYYDKENAEEIISWLKFLKPHWKPSEEQMKMLEYITRGNSYPHLTSLYQDLKKL